MQQSASENSGKETASDAGSRSIPSIDEQTLESGLKEIEEIVRRHPLSSVAVALSVGLVVGLLIRR